MISTNFITDFAQLAGLSNDWQRWADNGAGGIFQHWGFIQAFWAGHGSSLKLKVIAVRKDGRLIGLLPLQEREGTLEFLGAPESDASDVLCDDANTYQVLAAAIELLAQQRLPATLLYVPEDSKLLHTIGSVPTPLGSHLQRVYRCPARAMRLNAGPVPETGNDIRRKVRKLARLGEVSFKHLETAEEIREHLPVFFEQHISRAAAAGRASEFLTAGRRLFYESLAETLDPRSTFRFAVVMAGDRPVAYHAGFQWKGRLVHYKPTFDVDCWDLSPGDILLRNLLDYSVEAGLDELDFSIGDESYKLAFSNLERRTYALHFTPSLMQPAGLARVAWRSVEHQIRQRPAWLDAARSFKDRLGARGTSNGAVKTEANEAFVYCLKSNLARQTGTLSVLANFCGHNAPASSQEKVAECRRRLKAGEQFYFLRNGTETTVVWLKQSDEMRIPELGVDHRAPLSATKTIAYECWVGNDLRSARFTQEIFSALSQSGCVEGLYFYLLPQDRVERAWLASTGIHPNDHFEKNAPQVRPQTTRAQQEPTTETLIPQ